MNIPELIDKRIESLEDYIQKKSFASYDPYDGLRSPIASLFRNNHPFISRLWLQSVKLSPVNIRPLIGIKKFFHTKAVSDFASAYCQLASATNNRIYHDRASACLNLLCNLTSETTKGMGWGLRYPYATRFVKADAKQANIFQTINAIHAFLDGFEALKKDEYLEIARKGFLFLTDELSYSETDQTIAWNYWKNFPFNIYNVSALMIGLTARMWRIEKVDRYHTFSVKLYNFIASNQNKDGSWYYSDDRRGHFIDGFHTGYVLEGIARGILAGVLTPNDAITKGVAYYRKNLFTEDLLPRYFNTSTKPIEGQNFAQALQTFYFLHRIGMIKKDLIYKCFEITDPLLWNPKGYYNYKASRLLVSQPPMHRWVTGPMLLALSYIKSLESPRPVA